MGDELFDILGISLFSSGGTWCSLNNTPCIPLSSCSEFTEDDKCIHAKNSDTEENDNERYYKL